jgi:hypothetical protein
MKSDASRGLPDYLHAEVSENAEEEKIGISMELPDCLHAEVRENAEGEKFGISLRPLSPLRASKRGLIRERPA